MALDAGPAGTLWTANWKINSNNRGFQWRVNFANIDEATAVTRAADLSARMKLLLPGSAEIVFATLSNNNTTRDATFLEDALGVGEYVTSAGPPAVPAVVDQSQTALQIRLENPDRQSVQRFFNPIPDTILTDDLLNGAVASTTSLPLVLPDPGDGATWYEEFSNFMAALVKNTHYVKSGHASGGAYQYSAWRKAFLIRACKKKGARAFI